MQSMLAISLHFSSFFSAILINHHFFQVENDTDYGGKYRSASETISAWSREVFEIMKEKYNTESRSNWKSGG